MFSKHIGCRTSSSLLQHKIDHFTKVATRTIGGKKAVPLLNGNDANDALGIILTGEERSSFSNLITRSRSSFNSKDSRFFMMKFWYLQCETTKSNTYWSVSTAERLKVRAKIYYCFLLPFR